MPTKTSLKRVTLHKKVKLATGQSKGRKDDDKTLVFKKRGFRGNESGRVNTTDAIGVLNDDVKLRKHENRERRSLKSKAVGESENEQNVDGKGAKGRRTRSKKSRNLGQLEKGKVLQENRNTRETESFDNNDTKKWRPKLKAADKEESIKMHHDGNVLIKKDVKTKSESRKQLKQNHNDGKKLRPKLKAADEKKSVKMDSDGNSLLKKEVKSKSDLRKQLKQNHNVHAAEFLRKSWNKKFQDKKRVGDDLEENDDPPKKKKRIIRIDPYDISNKRLDDGIVTMGHIREKKEHAEENGSVQMSRNAQFRAIKPTPSILSFVEDNLLGRRRLIEFRRAGYNTELSAPLDNIPFSTSSERERIEESIFRNKLSFFAAANVSSSFPSPDLPEIAFAGRSNVGKSSLLNSLTRQWGVVRTSDKPGLTQTINFFKLGSKLCLVDLPGYGFAYAKEEVKEAWEELVKEYVSTRVGLKRVCLLIDTKWGMKPRDHELIELMERSQTKYQVVLTKTDLVFPIDVARRAMQIEESLRAKRSAVQPVMMVSSKSGAGIRSLRTVLAKIARFAKL
ncbi:hypothetical protein NMG60_11014410 [Bertholletia excelsa]